MSLEPGGGGGAHLSDGWGRLKQAGTGGRRRQGSLLSVNTLLYIKDMGSTKNLSYHIAKAKKVPFPYVPENFYDKLRFGKQRYSTMYCRY
jgi:hypothetical protein